VVTIYALILNNKTMSIIHPYLWVLDMQMVVAMRWVLELYWDDELRLCNEDKQLW